MNQNLIKINYIKKKLSNQKILYFKLATNCEERVNMIL